MLEGECRGGEGGGYGAAREQQGDVGDLVGCAACVRGELCLCAGRGGAGDWEVWVVGRWRWSVGYRVTDRTTGCDALRVCVAILCMCVTLGGVLCVLELELAAVRACPSMPLA